MSIFACELSALPRLEGKKNIGEFLVTSEGEKVELWSGVELFGQGENGILSESGSGNERWNDFVEVAVSGSGTLNGLEEVDAVNQ